MATTNTQFSELQKLLINVAENKCDAFIKTHINAAWEGPTETGELPEFNIAAGIDDVYYNKVVFLQKYNTIYTKGTFFGYIGDLVNDLQNGTTVNGITVKYDPTQNKIVTTVVAAEYDKDSDSWEHPSNVVTGSTVQEYVDAKVAGAVAEATAAMNFRGPITEGNFNDKQSKASNGDVYVVEGNFTIGEGDNAETFEEGDLVIFAKDGEAAATYTVVERNLDGAIVTGSAFNDGQLVVAEGTGKVKTTSYVTGSDNTTYTTFGTTTYTLATEKATAAYIAHKLGELDPAYTTVTYSGNYVNVSYALTPGGTVNDYTYTVSVVTKTLGDAVGMTLGEDGKWYAADGTVTTDGLATAADVANELVSDEKVIAAALNDHEARLDALEDFVGDTLQTELEIGEVTVNGLTAEVTTPGLVNAQLLVDVINKLDPWEEYTGE